MASNPDPPRRDARRAAPSAVDPETFREDFGEPITQLLNMKSWRRGRDLDAEYRRIEEEVREAVAHETDFQKQIREEVHPLLAEVENAPPGAGRHTVTAAEVAAVQRGLLFNGATQGCDGTCHVHDSLALTMYQVGVTLSSYHGDCDTWRHELFRRDLRRRAADPRADVLNELIRRRSQRGGLHEESGDQMSELARRGVMSFMERHVLLNAATAEWRIGHGSPAPLELICNYFTDLVIESIKVIRGLVDFGRFVFVASEPDDRLLLRVGQGLHPLEYAIVGTLRELVKDHLDHWRPWHSPSVDTMWDGATLSPVEWVVRFRDHVAPRVVYGVYRATRFAPPQVFYAHVDHAGTAARLAIADSILLEQRGFPLLIDLADRHCKAIYGGGSLAEMARTAYAAAGAPFRYTSERSTRES